MSMLTQAFISTHSWPLFWRMKWTMCFTWRAPRAQTSIIATMPFVEYTQKWIIICASEILCAPIFNGLFLGTCYNLSPCLKQIHYPAYKQTTNKNITSTNSESSYDQNMVDWLKKKQHVMNFSCWLDSGGDVIQHQAALPAFSTRCQAQTDLV